LNFLQALLLGVVQGICEFFPISSSAHLKLARHFLGLSSGQEEWVSFDLACHLGTWFVLAYYLRHEIWQTLQDVRKTAFIALALVPLVPAYFFLKPLRFFLSSPNYLGYFFILTSLLLFLASKIPPKPKQPTPSAPHFMCEERIAIPLWDKKWRDVIFIGLSQACALVPGLSRSGSTIATARFCGWTWIESAQFSFLLALPTILGGEVLESLKTSNAASIPFSYCAGGMLSSFIVGTGTVRLAFWMYRTERIWPFAWYCLLAGLFTIAIYR
jgi:undecaprenyl-diphosphatase